jgi:polyisoprenoid-binding protein YceI
MAHRYVAGTVIILALGMLIAGAPAPALAQEPARVSLALTSGRVTIAGSSNVHEWTAQTTNVRLTRVRVAASVGGSNMWDQIIAPGALEAFDIAIPAATLSSPKEGLDKNMHKALKVQQFAEITFRLLRLEPGTAADTLKGVGVLKIAGVEREVTLAIKTVRRDATLVVSGSVALLMTDFGIEPPKAMLGMLKTDPKVTISFEKVLAVSST